MAKDTGGLLALSRSGSVGKLVTFSTWRGRPYARLRVDPVQPNSPAQQGAAAIFRYLSRFWAANTSILSDAWVINPKTFLPLDRVGFLGANAKLLRGQTNLDNLKLWRLLAAGITARNLVVTPIAGGLNLTVDPVDAPASYAFLGGDFAIFPDQDPHALTTPLVTRTFGGPPYTQDFTGLAFGVKYQARVQLVGSTPANGLFPSGVEAIGFGVSG